MGRLEIEQNENPARFLVRAHGYVGPSLLRQDLAAAHAFGQKHPGGWDYVVDTTFVRFANPLNPLWLTRIRRLPHLRRYIVIAPSAMVRIMMALASWLVKPDLVVRSSSDLL